MMRSADAFVHSVARTGSHCMGSFRKTPAQKPDCAAKMVVVISPCRQAASCARRALAFLSFLLAVFQSGPASAFGFEDVAARAELQAHGSYQRVSRRPPAELQALTYDQYRDIRFRPDHALWRAENLPFELMFFHLGKFQTESVLINEVTPQGVRHIPYKSADFNYGKNKLSPQMWGDVGFAGFRAHYPLNGGAYKDELVVFLGASYFRALGAGLHYGLSARGLAIDTVGGQG
jgi:periplasmic glucans biosynthesis protein